MATAKAISHATGAAHTGAAPERALQKRGPPSRADAQRRAKERAGINDASKRRSTANADYEAARASYVKRTRKYEERVAAKERGEYVEDHFLISKEMKPMTPVGTMLGAEWGQRSYDEEMQKRRSPGRAALRMANNPRAAMRLARIKTKALLRRRR